MRQPEPTPTSPAPDLLDSLELSEGVRTLAKETRSFVEERPETSVRSARAALIAVVRNMGGRGNLDQDIRDLEDTGKISGVVAIEMRTIQRIRNKVEYQSAKVTSDDARTCFTALVAILKALSGSKS